MAIQPNIPRLEQQRDFLDTAVTVGVCLTVGTVAFAAIAVASSLLPFPGILNAETCRSIARISLYFGAGIGGLTLGAKFMLSRTAQELRAENLANAQNLRADDGQG